MRAIIAVPATLLIVYRAWLRKSLTPAGIFAAVLTAAAHSIHPWNLPFVLLLVFFLAGTRVTKVKHDVKAKLTMQAGGSSSDLGGRTHIQVLANSGVASILILLHAYQLSQREQKLLSSPGSVPECYALPGDLLMVGIVANYAAVTADTFSSELGILSATKPRLITSVNLRTVPPGTNGGVTLWGLVAGLLGSLMIATTSVVLIPFCPPSSSQSGTLGGLGWNWGDKLWLVGAITLWGGLGSVVDSLLGGWFQESVVDTRSGRIVEGQGGTKVLVSPKRQTNLYYKQRVGLVDGQGRDSKATQGAPDGPETEMDKYDAKKKFRMPAFGDEKPSRRVESGSLGLLDNNEVNFLMALTMSLGAMAVASWAWGIPLRSIVPV